MTICSLVVFARPERSAEVEKEIAALQGVEVHGGNDEGKLVVSIDHPDRDYCSETIIGMDRIDGVISTSLVYEFYE